MKSKSAAIRGARPALSSNDTEMGEVRVALLLARDVEPCPSTGARPPTQ